MVLEKPDRRTVLKGFGAGMVGSAAYTGITTAKHEDDDARDSGPGKNKTQCWADGGIFDLLDADFYSGHGDSDQEGNDEAHEPLYEIAATDPRFNPDAHSPHFAGHDIVVPLPPGFNGDSFTAQWHVKWVKDTQSFTEGNFVNQDSAGNYLLSASAIESAAGDPEEDVHLVDTGFVFTCPIAMHAPPGHTHED